MGTDIGNVRDPDTIRTRYIKLLLQAIGCSVIRSASFVFRLLVLVYSLNIGLTHQSFNPLAPTVNAQIAQLIEYARTAVHAAVIIINLPDLHCELTVSDCTIGFRAA